jgi:hypothetical protein
VKRAESPATTRSHAHASAIPGQSSSQSFGSVFAVALTRDVPTRKMKVPVG